MQRSNGKTIYLEVCHFGAIEQQQDRGNMSDKQSTMVEEHAMPAVGIGDVQDRFEKLGEEHAIYQMSIVDIGDLQGRLEQWDNIERKKDAIQAAVKPGEEKPGCLGLLEEMIERGKPEAVMVTTYKLSGHVLNQLQLS